MREASALLAAKILVVDDQPANVLLLERMLGDADTRPSRPRSIPMRYARSTRRIATI